MEVTPFYWPQPPVRPPPPHISPSAIRFRNDGWIIALVVLASLGLVLTFSLWIYLAWRIVRSRSRWRAVWPGQVLLGSLFVAFLLLFAFVPRQTPVTCGILRFGIGVAHALYFATLLLKLIIIIARNKGIFLPVSVEILLLVLAVGVQVAVNAHWLIILPPAHVFHQFPDGSVSCNISIYSWLHSLVYVMLLMVAGVVTSVRARRIKDNHREPMFIGLVFGFSVPLWLVWTSIASSLPHAHEQCLAFGLLANATLVLFAMFIPKVRQLSAIGTVGMYREDRPIPKTMTEMTVQKIYYPVYPENGTRPVQLDVGRYMRHLYDLGSSGSAPSMGASPSPALALPRYSRYPQDGDPPAAEASSLPPPPRLTPMPDEESTTLSDETDEDEATTHSRHPAPIPTYARVHKHVVY